MEISSSDPTTIRRRGPDNESKVSLMKLSGWQKQVDVRWVCGRAHTEVDIPLVGDGST